MFLNAAKGAEQFSMKHSIWFALLGLAVLPSPAALAVPGFFKIDDKTLPPAVRKAAASVFRGVVLSGEPQLKLTPDQYDAAIANLEAQKVESTEPFELRLPRLQAELVRRCKNTGAPTCESAFPHIDGGTFFVVGDTHTLMTARHVIEEAVGSVNQTRLCEMRGNEVNMRLILLDQNGRIAFESVNGAGRALLKQSGEASLVSASAIIPELQALGEDYALDADDAANDFAIIQLNTEIAPVALQWSATLGARDETYFPLGFPSQTFNREMSDAANSDGLSLYATRGVEIAVAPMLFNDDGTQVPRPKDGVAPFVKALSDNTLIIDSDINIGMSGGPVVDSAGRVYGVAVLGFTDLPNVELDHAAPKSVWAVRPNAISGINDILKEFLNEACE